MTLLELIEQRKYQEAADLLASTPALASEITESGVPASLIAAYHGQRELARAIVQARGTGASAHEAAALDIDPPAGTDWQSMSADGFTPLHLACFFNNPKAAKLSLDHGAFADAVARNAAKVRPIHSAVAGKSLECVQLLIDHGADPNTVQQGGFTALMSAAALGNRQICELLIGAGADSAIKDEQGRTASDHAREHGVTDLP